MPNVTVVLEASARDEFALWPTGGTPPFAFLPLNGRMAPEDIGTAFATMASGGETGGPASAVLAGLPASDGIYAPGGLRIEDPAGGPPLWPGCCCGVEDWHEWAGIADGADHWLGHDPWPTAVRDGDLLRLRPDHGVPAFSLPLSDLAGILATARADLTGFVASARAWTADVAPELAEDVGAWLARELRVDAP